MTDKIIQILSNTLESEIDANATQSTCEKWDSFRHLNIIVALEELFDCSFEPEEIAIMKDIPTIARIIREKSVI